MYIIVLGFLILRLQMSVSFPMHMDFQKVGEVIFNNEKYNILKPTTHIITDYFKDFMLRRDNINFPTKRIFIDHNGFRHAWSGFGEKIKSLRKTDHVHKNINENSIRTDAETRSQINETTKNEKATGGREEKATDDSNQENNSTESKDLSHKYTENYESSNEGTLNNNSATKEDTSHIEDPSKIKLRDGDKSKSAPAAITAKQSGATQAPKKDISSRTIAQTTFFCPFFGVITMSAFID